MRVAHLWIAKRQNRDNTGKKIHGVSLKWRNEHMGFYSFWRYLRKKTRTLKTLGGRSTIIIDAKAGGGTVISSRGKSHAFSIDDAKDTWKRYERLPGPMQKMASGYAVPNKRNPQPQNWKECPNKTCCPWIAAAIHAFESRM
jgi:hypothetical protein